MKTLSKLAAFFIFICSTIFGQTYGLDGLDPSLFEKYRVPVINYRSIYLNTRFNYNSIVHNSNNNFESNDRLYENYQFQLQPVFNCSYESEEKEYGFVGNVRLIGNSRLNKWEYEPNVNKNHVISYSYQINLSPKVIYYVQNSDYFFSSSLNAEILIDRSDEKYSNNGDTNAEFVKYDNQEYEIEIGFGYGKIRNVTPLVQAARFQNRLMVLNKLNNRFNDETMLALAQQFSKSAAYNTVYDRVDKFFWNDIESILNNNGISLNELNQYSNSYIREVENELKFLRYEGCRISSIINLDYTKIRQHRTNGSYANPLEETSLLSAGIKAELSKQINLRSQFRTEISLKGGSFLTNNPIDKQEYSIQNMIGYWYELTDRFVIQCTNSFQYTIRNSSETGHITQNIFTMSANYFWEDNITSGFSYNWQHIGYNDIYRYVDHTQNTQSINFNLSYIFTSNFLMK